MFSTIFLYAIAGYFGRPSASQFSSWLSNVQFSDWGPDPGPDDGPIRRIKIPPIKWPPPRPWWWSSLSVLGGVLGGFAVNYGFPNDMIIALAGAVFSGRILNDIGAATLNPQPLPPKTTTPRYF